MEAASQKRLCNWDVLRTVAMFLVVSIHMASYLSEFSLGETVGPLTALLFICDPLFFALSGYFALVPLKPTALKTYFLKKINALICPLIVFSILLFCFNVLIGECSLSLYSYFAFFIGIFHSWWFIPNLLPLIIAAPFLAKAIDSITAKQAFVWGGVVLGALFGLGAFIEAGRHIFSAFGPQTVALFFDLLPYLFVPSFITPTMCYVAFFIFGGLFRKMVPALTARRKRAIVIIGMIALILYPLSVAFGFPHDIGSGYMPNYLLFFSTFAVFVITNELTIKGPRLRKVFAWTAKRSYSIYLLHITVLTVCVAPMLQRLGLPESLNGESVFMNFLLWLLCTIGAYFITLFAASILDPLVLNPLQKLYRKCFIKPSVAHIDRR